MNDPSKADPPKRKRPWFQFSLRTLLVFSTVSAIAAGWLGKMIEHNRANHSTAEAIRAMGGQAFYYNKDPATPAWLDNVFGDEFDREVLYVTIVDTPLLTDSKVEVLKGLTELKGLRLSSTEITDVGLKNLIGLTKLQMLDLRWTNVTENGVSMLQRALPADCVIYRCAKERPGESNLKCCTSHHVERIQGDQAF